MDENGHRIDPGRHMFEGDAVLLKDLKDFSPKTDFGVHHRLVDVHCAEAFLSCNACDRVVRAFAGVLNDHGTRIFRTVCVADVDRDSLFSYREDRILVENACAHVGELTELCVSDRFDRSRIVDDPRVSDKETGDIGPVLIEISLDRTGNDGTCDIGAAAGEGVDCSIRLSTVESRDDSLL